MPGAGPALARWQPGSKWWMTAGRACAARGPRERRRLAEVTIARRPPALGGFLPAPLPKYAGPGPDAGAKVTPTTILSAA
jgi:hypothetical protein